MRVFKIVLLSLFLFFTTVLYVVTTPVFWVSDFDTSELSVSPTKLESYVTDLSFHYAGRSHDRVKRLDQAAVYISSQWEKMGLEVEEQPYFVNNRHYKNLFVRFGPDEGEKIIIGAHYDVHGNLPGADDNASGVAGLLELSRLLVEQEPELTSPVELVAYTLEEMPYFRTEYMGSFIHAKAQEDVKAMISLEMIGYFSDEENSQKFPSEILKAFYPTTGNFIAVVGNLGQHSLIRTVKKAMKSASDLPVYSLSAPASIPGIDFSDHRNYWAFGFPAVMVTDTAFYRNLNYHTPHDTAEKLDYEKMAEVVKGVYAAVLALD